MNKFSATAIASLVFGLVACGDNLHAGANGDDDGSNGGGDGGIGSNGDGSPGDATTSAPTVVSTTPASARTNVSVNERVTATFSRAMNGATLTPSTFTLSQGSTPITGVVTYSGTTATFTPSSPLDLSLVYTARITTGAKDAQGIALASNHEWSFTTGACSHATVALRTVANFGVLAGSTVTNDGSTTVTGDLGVSPGTAVTGFPPGIVIGAIHAGDAAAATALADLTTAYNDAAARTLCAVTVAGNLGGMTLAPGLYKSTGSIAISSGELTLDAQGDADAVFIFQTTSTLTVTSGRQVVLAGGASAANIFWQVGTAAVIGTTAKVSGTIMADQAITLGTGATLDGRALARIAAVALDGNAVTKP